MRNPLFQAICRVGMFMICAQAIVHFRPNEAYEKYLKLLVSVMILIQLFLPIGSFLLGGGMEETARKLEQFRTQLEQEMQAVTREAAEADKLLENMTLEEIRRRVDEQQEGSEAEEGREENSAGWNGTEEEGTGQKDTGGQDAEGVQAEAAGTVKIPEVSVPETSVSIEEGKAK